MLTDPDLPLFSNPVGLWWVPDSLFSMFIGSGSDMVHLPLPAVTQECLENRIDVSKRCELNQTEDVIFGDSRGSCDRPHVNTLKIAASNMKSSISENDNLKARMSPAYSAYDDFTMTTTVVNDILTGWASRGVDKYGFDLRLETCQWVADNLEHVVKTMIPESHPRTYVESQNTALAAFAISLAVIAIIISIGTTAGVTFKWKKKSLKGVQIEFLCFLLAGVLMISIGSLLLALEPSTSTCTASIWFMCVGYTTELVPTLIRVSTIIKIVRNSMKLKVVKVNKKKLIGKSIGFCILVSAFYCSIMSFTYTSLITYMNTIIGNDILHAVDDPGYAAIQFKL